MSRFMQDNSHLQLLNSIPKPYNDDITSTFSHAVIDHVHSFTSQKHLDVGSITTTHHNERFLPAKKYIFSSFTEPEVDILKTIYLHVYPSFFTRSMTDTYFPCSFKKNALCYY